MSRQTSSPRQAAPPAPARDKEKVTPGKTGTIEETGLVKGASTEVGPVIDFFNDSGLGNQDVGTRDIALPYLAILQKNSPQVDPDQSKLIRGAGVGMIFNTVTNALYDGKEKGVLVVPCYYVRKFVEWVPREAGGGFVAQYSPEDEIVAQTIKNGLVNDKGKLVNEKGNLLTETAYHYVLLLGDDGPEWAIIGMASTQLKPSRTWNSLIAGIKMRRQDGTSFNPPRFSHVYQLRTNVQRKGENTWYVWSPSLVETVKDRAVYDMAKEYSLMAPMVNVAPRDEDDDHETAGAEGRGERPF
jgi:hypothetical protein